MYFLRKLPISIAFYIIIHNFSCFKSNSTFLQNPGIFLQPKFWTFWEILLVQLHCTAKLKPLDIFEKFYVFFGKPIFSLAKTPTFWKFWEILPFQSHSTSNWLTLVVFKNSRSFFEKTFFFQKPNFRVILLYQSILRQVCYL